jgi:hypothetical protein
VVHLKFICNQHKHVCAHEHMLLYPNVYPTHMHTCWTPIQVFFVHVYLTQKHVFRLLVHMLVRVFDTCVPSNYVCVCFCVLNTFSRALKLSVCEKLDDS